MNASTTPVDASVDGPAVPSAAESSPTQPEVEAVKEETPEELAKRAEKVKESGNVAFKTGRYGEAIDLYTEAIREHTIPKSPLRPLGSSHRFKLPLISRTQSH